MQRHILFIIMLVMASATAQSWHTKNLAGLALITEPVVDLSIKLPLPTPTELAASPDKISDGTCRRSHQGLLNEVVRIIDSEATDVCIAFDNVIYGIDPQTQQPLNSFWIPHHKLVLLQDLSPEALAAVPAPRGADDATLVLHLPWDHYSLGTRFVHTPAHDTQNHYGVRYVDLAHNSSHIMHIPKSHASIETIPASPEEARTRFVQLAHRLIDHVKQHGDNAVIPYVWGGSSFIIPYEDTTFSLKEGWQRPGPQPYMGYDCSELILRLAQTCGIPYTCKITSMMGMLLKELQPDEALTEGDLIWMPGHVMIIASLRNNEVIESRGYSSGYGRVHRITLAECFEGIATYAQLQDAITAQQPLTLLKRDGSAGSVIKELKIFKLA